MNALSIQTKEECTCEIFSERGIFSSIEERANFVLTDSNVFALYGNKIKDKFSNAAIYAMPAGEEYKTEETLFSLLREMKKAELTRGDTFACVGGGVVGDLGGLAAALYMRGIDCIQVPTTLLSQADSSVGGKCAIDFEGIKNLVGVFRQPKKVYIDCDFLKTLPEREIRCGLGEIVKHGALNRELFEVLYHNRNRLFDLDFIESILFENIKIKADVVTADAGEKGLRRCLNLAHTTAHALELWDKKLSHGEYVLVGILFEAEIAKHLLKEADETYLNELKELARLALKENPRFAGAGDAAQFARLDKKNSEKEKIGLIVPKRCGEYAFLELADQEYARMLNEIGETLC